MGITAIEHLCKAQSSLIDKGNICISKTLQIKNYYCVLNTENVEAIFELEDQSDVSNGENDLVSFEFPIPRAELQPNNIIQWRKRTFEYSWTLGEN